ncbi:MAG: DUF86 domain-containing protein, partial [Bdellovibrio sp.]|nr:DUF86 domain-containing protein [Bdellovibrio sp.]
KQDSIFMNLERACQAAIDFGMHLVRTHKLGIPKDSRDSFRLLEKANLLPVKLSKNLQEMDGFRNMAVHRYREVDLKIVEDVIKNRLDDFMKFIKVAIKIKRKNKNV